MSRFQGTGTDYYGFRDFRKADRSFIATHWRVLFLLPIWPIESVRLRRVSFKQQAHYYVVAVGSSSSVTYQILEKIPIKENRIQIIRTLLFCYGTFLSLFLGFVNIFFVFIGVGLALFYLVFYIYKDIKIGS